MLFFDIKDQKYNLDDLMQEEAQQHQVIKVNGKNRIILFRFLFAQDILHSIGIVKFSFIF